MAFRGYLRYFKNCSFWFSCHWKGPLSGVGVRIYFQGEPVLQSTSASSSEGVGCPKDIARALLDAVKATRRAVKHPGGWPRSCALVSCSHMHETSLCRKHQCRGLQIHGRSRVKCAPVNRAVWPPRSWTRRIRSNVRISVLTTSSVGTF